MNGRASVIGAKKCHVCGISKPIPDFYKCKSRPDGLAKRCKSCDKEITARYRANNPDRRKETQSRWYQANKERWVQYRENQNPELTAQANKRYYRQNVAQFVAHTALRRTRKLQATPEWADLAVIRKMYAEAKRLDDETGVKHHVDHIVPLKHPLVCGLHCEANLRVIPAKDNFAKNNRYWPNMPNGN